MLLQLIKTRKVQGWTQKLFIIYVAQSPHSQCKLSIILEIIMPWKKLSYFG